MQPKEIRDNLSLITAVIALVLSFLALLEKLSLSIILALAMSAAGFGSIFIATRRSQSRIEPNISYPKYPKVIRIVSRYSAITLLFGALAVSGANIWYRSNPPKIIQIRPIDPIAGAILDIFGDFPRSSSELSVRLGDDPVREIRSLSEHHLQVRVPLHARSGPLYVIRRSKFFPLLPDSVGSLDILTVQRVDSELELLHENLKAGADHLAVGFSILNSSKVLEMVITDIDLELLLSEKVEPSNVVKKRVDLGDFSVSADRLPAVRKLTTPSTSLLAGSFVLSLKPQTSETLVFRIQSPKNPHDFHIIFLVKASGFDSAGRRRTAYIERVFNVVSNDIYGFKTSGDLPLTQDSLVKLRDLYGSRFNMPNLNRNQ